MPEYVKPKDAWEPINSSSLEAVIQRTPVPGGWIYLCSYRGEIATTFVPDENAPKKLKT